MGPHCLHSFSTRNIPARSAAIMKDFIFTALILSCAVCTFALASAEDALIEANLQELRAGNETGNGVLVPITFSRMAGDENELDSVDGLEEQENEESMESSESGQAERGYWRYWCYYYTVRGRRCRYCLFCYYGSYRRCYARIYC